jgi:SAM-dependent methyltransferase
MSHEEKIAQWIGRGQVGTEIGPGASPVPGLDPAPIYVDCFKIFGDTPCRADYYGHACALPFHDHSLDYVLASHVLEHVANPIAALAEWHRVVRPGGIIYLIVPDRRATWEHGRALTSMEHMLEDYVRGTTAVDATHIDEFVFQADWSIFSPGTPPEDVPAKQAELARTMHWAVENGQEINIHFHTFEAANLRGLLERLSRGPDGRARSPFRAGHEQAQALHQSNELLTAGSGIPALPGSSGPAEPESQSPVAPRSEDRAVPRFNWEIVDFAECFPAANPNGVLAILRVDKTWRARAEAEAFRVRSPGNPQAVLRSDAQRFADWAAGLSGPAGAS